VEKLLETMDLFRRCLFCVLYLLQFGLVHFIILEKPTHIQWVAACVNVYLNCLVFSGFILLMDLAAD